MSTNGLPKFTERIQARITEKHLKKLMTIAEREGNDIASVLRRIIGEYEETGNRRDMRRS
jgi:hypothetical protein